MILGIDLGTTYSVGAYIDESGKPVAITNSDSKTITPSVVYFESADSAVVGEIAKANSFIQPQNVVSLVKNYMGETDEDGNPVMFKTDYGSYPPEYISSLILKKIVSDATKFLGLSEPIRDVVVTKPAYFEQAQIKATEHAISLAGLNCVNLLNEPTAAALYYATKTNLSKANILVYDLGGGTFDVSIVHLENGNVDSKGSAGLKMVGGSFFDEIIARKICNDIKNKHGIDIYDDPAYVQVKQKLFIDVEEAKIKLSSVQETTLSVFCPPISETIKLTREDINETVSDLYAKTENLVFRALRDAEMEPSDLDKVIMTGGSAKIPYIEEHLSQALGMPVSREVNPNEVVALGAALNAKHLESGGKCAQKFTDISSHGIGIKALDAKNKVFNDILIPRNTKLPAENERSYEVSNDQAKLTLTVLEGDFKEIDYAKAITTVNVELPKGVSKGDAVIFKFTLDEKQLLHIFMRIPSVGLESEISFDRNDNMSSPEFSKWKKMIKGACDSIDARNGLIEKKSDEKKKLFGAVDTEKKNESSPKVKLPKIIESSMGKTIGLMEVKEAMRDLYNRLDSIKNKGQVADKVDLCVAILGKSGMGMTHSSLLVANCLYSIGAVSTKTIITARKNDIIMQDVQGTTQKVNDFFQQAMDGVLIFDDFHYFYNDNVLDAGMVAVDMIAEAYDAAQGKVAVVINGDIDIIKKLFDKKSKFRRLFELFTVELTGYSGDEYIELVQERASIPKKVVDPNAYYDIKKYLRGCNRDPKFEYIYTIDSMLNEAIKVRANKAAELRHPKDEDFIVLRLEDFDIKNGAKTYEELMDELNSLIGLKNVKEEIEKLANQAKIQKTKADKGMGEPQERAALNLVFTGNPGTGKTTVARLISEILRELGILTKGQLVEVDRSKLVVQYVGATAPMVNAKVDEAIGGVLFIDEAYSLWTGPEDNFGKEAVDALLKRMEDDRNQLVVIIAGYEDKINEFMRCNEGLPSRFTKYINFDDYSLDELMQVFDLLLNQQNLIMDEDTHELVRDTIQDTMRDKTFGNARGVRKLFESIKLNMEARLGAREDKDNITAEEFRLIKPEDIEGAKAKRKDIKEILEELDNMTGLHNVKKKLHDFANTVMIDQMRAEQGGPSIGVPNMHMLFTGNPGTGKTTVARMVGEILRALNLLSNGGVVEVNTEDFTGKYVGDADTNVKQLVEDNIGKVLFIDEAYRLADSQYGISALQALVARMENNRENFCLIMAGYTDKMDDLLKLNQGLRSRFANNIIEFEDYTNDELIEVFRNMMKAPEYANFKYDETVVSAVSKMIREKNVNIEFGNARGVRNIVEKAVQCQSTRVARVQSETGKTPDLFEILAEDILDDGDERKSSKARTKEEVLAELNALVGMADVKAEVTSLINKVSMNQLRAQRGLGNSEPPTMNMQFLGNPGTGKTTVARMIGEIYQSIGVLPTSKVVEVDRAALVAQYVGQTAPLVEKVFNSALGGVLFIDEAYSLNRGPEDTFGLEAIDKLLKLVEDNRGKLAVIIAGYSDEMEQFIQTNSGLPSRFNKKIIFNDYSLDECVTIFASMLKGKGFEYEEGVLDAARTLIMTDMNSKGTKEFANARGVRNIRDRVLANLDTRVSAIPAPTNDDLITVKVEDVY